MNHLLPKRMFFTKGVGYHRKKLQSFELALRDAGIEMLNLVTHQTYHLATVETGG